jgi:signal transduction histidine kinase
MRLYTKLAFLNTISKGIIFTAFVFFLPLMVRQVVLHHTDQRLHIMKERLIGIINRVGINTFIKSEGDTTFSSYNILKEDFISLEPIADTTAFLERIENTPRNIENVIVDYRVLSFVFQSENKRYLLEIGKSLVTISQLNETIKRFSFYTLILILAITIVVDIGFADYLLKPFQNIIEKKLKPVKHPSDFDFREIKTTTTDFKYLDKSINEMMEKINAAFLREKEFTGNVSHELLTPVSLLQSRLENILTDATISEHVAMKVVESQKTLTRLNKIITALLVISRIEHEQYLKEESVTIQPLLKEVADEIEERLSERNIKINFELGADYIFPRANKSLLFTLFFNLINNAIKYNVQNGSIRIRSMVENGKFIVEVKDTGIGIEAEKIKVLFDRFRKHKKTDGQSYGLGLPIVKAVADFHKIEIDIFSEVGVGSAFLLIFPT